MDAGFVPLFVKLPPAHIVELKFLLESYEGLGIIRTLNQQTGEIVVLATTDTAAEARRVLESAAEALELRFVPTPESVSGDWLLADEDLP